MHEILEPTSDNHTLEPLRCLPTPPLQEAYRLAVHKALAVIRRQTPEQFGWLGATPAPGGWELDVLGGALRLMVASGEIVTADREPVRSAWQILVLHYLSIAGRPARQSPQITFADLPAGRGYAEVYRKRTVGRLCATVGRTRDSLRAAAATMGGRETSTDPLTFVFDVFPGLATGLLWYDPDDEFPPGATWLLPPNIEMYFSTEDIVVLCECCVSRLEGKPF